MSGLFNLATPVDLREKLRRDFQAIITTPLSPDAAFNFFVTAEHMLDWVFPKRANSSKRKNAKANSVVLRICSHLANGAKHFEVEDPQHDSVVAGTTGGGYFNAQYFAPSYFPHTYFGAGRRLVVKLKGGAAAALGPSIEVLVLAKQVMEYWDKHPLV
jgi:hypothetical protein